MRKLLLLGAAGLALAACNPEQSAQGDQAQITAGAPFALMLAPAYEALPPAPQPVPIAYAPAPVAQQYWDDAYLMSYDYEDQPPAYFNYSGATPLVWRQPNSNGDIVTRIVEAVIGGGLREYFYEPGFDTPFFVRDPQYAYAFDDDGRLVAVYDPYGQPLGQTLVTQRAPYAATYLMRADNLRDAALAAALQELAPDVWTTQRAVLVRELDDTDAERAWRTWWQPGDTRSPVAVQRLAEVRARKAERDAAHAAWKADKEAGKAVKWADRRAGRDDDRRVARAEGPKARADRPANNGNGRDKADKPGKQATADRGPGDRGAKGKGDGPGNGKGGGEGKGKNG